MNDPAKTLADVFASIDAVNATDPTAHVDGPLALVQGRLATIWLGRLDADPSPPLQVAARAHHLCRWEIARRDYPTGRAGYLQWRRDNKKHQADSAATILVRHAWADTDIARVRDLLGRTRLRTDPETQTLEDVACLVFLETQFADMVARTEHDHMVDIVAKTLRKMSAEAIAASGTLALDDAGRLVIGDAVASLETRDAE